MTTNELKEALFYNEYLKGKTIGATNFNGAGLGEADVILVSNSKMVWEYEVKMSRGDFKADFKKENKHRLMSDKAYLKQQMDYSYHMGWMVCPNYFHYVCAEGLIKEEEIPEYAGLIYINTDGTQKVVKRGKKLHNYEATNRLIWSIARSNTARMIFGCSYMNFKRRKSLSL